METKNEKNGIEKVAEKSDFLQNLLNSDEFKEIRNTNVSELTKVSAGNKSKYKKTFLSDFDNFGKGSKTASESSKRNQIRNHVIDLCSNLIKVTTMKDAKQIEISVKKLHSFMNELLISGIFMRLVEQFIIST